MLGFYNGDTRIDVDGYEYEFVVNQSLNIVAKNITYNIFLPTLMIQKIKHIYEHTILTHKRSLLVQKFCAMRVLRITSS